MTSVDLTSDETSTSELVAEIRETRQRVSEDVEALKSELSADHLKHRALDMAERSLESVGIRVVRRLSSLPQSLANVAREHPAAATAIGISGAVLLLGLRARRARRRSWLSLILQ